MLRISAFFLLALAAVAQSAHEGNNPFPPYKIIGNIYYVGADDVTSYLITTPKGHIVINAGYEDTVPIIEAGIRKLGFKPSDVKILLNGQAHFDHVAGLSGLQKVTGAKIWSSEREVAVLESGGAKDPRWGREVTYPPVHVDHVVRDGETLRLGGVDLVAHLTPGHSIGCTTWTMKVADAGKSYDVVFVGGTTINPGVRFLKDPTWPGIAEDYQRTFQVLHSLPCDVFLGAHGGYYGMQEKVKRMNGPVNPFIDPQGYRDFIDKSERTFQAQLAAEKAER
ncbi:MAG TPA: subclass B3 metallo-beta-lactamase [Verrucomicrobiae bacterium]|nr:subclass B3 metallo-beta-lactamase [Verrucomicrobiae bacterium]